MRKLRRTRYKTRAGLKCEWSNLFVTTALPDGNMRKVAGHLHRSSLSLGSLTLDGEAIRFLVANPGRNTDKNVMIQSSSNHLGKLANNDPVGASEWIQNPPAGHAKLWARKNLNSVWSEDDPKAAKEWTNSLPAGTRDQITKLKR